MKFKPSALETCISKMPEDLQILALQVIAEEKKRFDEGRFTEEEIRFQNTVKELGKNCRKTIDNIILKYIK